MCLGNETRSGPFRLWFMLDFTWGSDAKTRSAHSAHMHMREAMVLEIFFYHSVQGKLVRT